MNKILMLSQSVLKKLRNKLPLWKMFVVAVGIILLIAGGLYYWFYSQRYVSTENAYLNGNVVQIAPRITGQVAHLYVENNQFVEKGKVLFELDRVPFEVAVKKAESQFAIDQAALQNAQSTSARTIPLVKKHYVSSQAGDDIVAKLKSAEAALKLSEANLIEAKLQLTYTQVIAPTSGWITNLVLREGNLISENQPICALINNADFWVDANFKETELGAIKANQKAYIKIDMYPNKQFLGIVKSISGGSGTAFSLMPPQNATGNWVKVTQRVPVRVQLLDVDQRYPYRIGTSAKVTIDLQSANNIS